MIVDTRPYMKELFPERECFPLVRVVRLTLVHFSAQPERVSVTDRLTQLDISHKSAYVELKQWTSVSPCPLVRPIMDEKSLQKLDTVPQVRLAPDYDTCPTSFTACKAGLS